MDFLQISCKALLFTVISNVSATFQFRHWKDLFITAVSRNELLLCFILSYACCFSLLNWSRVLTASQEESAKTTPLVRGDSFRECVNKDGVTYY